MPALISSSQPLLDVGSPHATRDVTEKAWQVICAWPVSGQYGPGTRVLYYLLVAACVLARKAEWLRNACLAAALILPAVAAIHGVVLATLHFPGAVDMDVYGAFQLCSIGILAAPVTVRLSSTYFNTPGRNTIFLWTGLILAGLLALTVEFYRANPTSCVLDVDGASTVFPYSEDNMCNLICSVNDERSPTSPIRQGSEDNIYVIPEPHRLTFGAATLVAAACCIPAILSMISMWDKIVEINWKSRFGSRDVDGVAAAREMKGVNAMVRGFLSAVEIPLFSSAVLAILIVGELNFWSEQVYYQTETITGIGQWAPIVGSALAACGSLYMLLAEDFEAATLADTNSRRPHSRCTCAHHHSPESNGDATNTAARTSEGSAGMAEAPSSRQAPAGVFINDTREDALLDPTNAHQLPGASTDVGNRRKVARVLTKIGNVFGNASADRFYENEYQRGKAMDFPEIPGEENRNRDIFQIREQYNPQRDASGYITPNSPGRRSRTASFNGSVASNIGDVGLPQPPSQRMYADTLLSPSRPSRPTSIRLDAEASDLGEKPSGDMAGLDSPLTPPQDGGRLAVPSAAHLPISRNMHPGSTSSTSYVAMPGSSSSPAVIISPEEENYSTTDKNPC